MKLRWLNGGSDDFKKWDYEYWLEIDELKIPVSNELMDKFFKKNNSQLNGTGTNMFRGAKQKELTKELYKWLQYDYLLKKVILDIQYSKIKDNILVSFKENGRIMGYQINSEIMFDDNEIHELMNPKKLCLIILRELEHLPFESIVLKFNRELVNMDQNTLAKNIGLTKQEISRWENGVVPRKEKQEMIANYLNFDKNEFDIDYWKFDNYNN